MRCGVCQSHIIIDNGVFASNAGKVWRRFACASCGNTWHEEERQTDPCSAPVHTPTIPKAPKAPTICSWCGSNRYRKAYRCAAALCADCSGWISGCGNTECEFCVSGYEDEPTTQRYLDKKGAA